MIKNLSKGILSAYFLVLSLFAYSQSGGVSINNSNTAAHPSAMLDVSSSSAPFMGMLIPRMSTANRNLISSPATGLQIFNTDCGVNEYYTGTCWVSMSQNLRPPNPITCSGTTDFCANSTRTFTIPLVNGATTYFWTVPAGATIISGQTTPSATVLFGNHSGDVCVTAENNCEASQPRCINVYINPVPTSPGNITGPNPVAPGATASYFIAGIAGVNLYNWTVPAGATIISGAGTTSITVSFSCSAVSGNISVTAENNCGAGPPSTLAITLSPLTANAGSGVVTPGGTLGGSPTASGGTLSYFYAWSPTTNLSGTNVSNPIVSSCATTVYTVTVTDINGCSAVSSATASFAGSVSGSQTFGYTGSIATFTVPVCVTSLTIEAWGAQGGNGSMSGGLGAYMKGTFSVSPGNVLLVGVGQQAPAGNSTAAGGGGSSGVYKQSTSTHLIIAGAGGGSGSSSSVSSTMTKDAVTGTSGQNTYGCGGSNNLVGNGGTGGAGGAAGSNPCGDWPRASGGGGINSAGSNGDSGSGGGAFSISGAAGGNVGANGTKGGWGYTGGGGSSYGGGGGGGYSGGAGGASASGYTPGGGGGSYNGGTNPTNTAGVQTGNGQVVISW